MEIEVRQASLGSGGVSDHGALTGLDDDDHAQYHNDSRGDARYWPLSTDLATQAELDAHTGDGTAAHAASAISIEDAAGDFTATDVEGALAELQADHEADANDLVNHLADATAAHAASAVSFTPTGTIAATNVQDAIAEVASEGGGGGGGTALTVSEDGTPVDASVAVIDFLGADFDVTESPEDEVNVAISTAIARQADLDAHINDTTDAHDASAISFPVPAAIEQVGTVLEFSPGSAETGTVSSAITVPAGTTKVLVGVSGYQGSNNGLDSMTFTKGGVDTAMTKVAADTSNAKWQAALFYLDDPDIGAGMSLKWDWLGAMDNPNPKISVTFWSGTDAGVRSSGSDQDSLPLTTGLLDVVSGDKIVAWTGLFTGGSEGTVDTWDNLTELAEVGNVGNSDGAWATADPVADTTVGVSAATNLTEGGLCAVVLIADTSVLTDVETKINDLESDLLTDEAALAAHLADTTAAHAATAISFTPAGTIAATTVQAAIEEVAAEAGGGAVAAEDVTVADSGGNFTATDVEGVLAEIAGQLGGGGLWDAYALLREEQAAGVDSGTFSSGSWVERVLNTEVFDSAGFVGALSGNEFALDAGTYFFIARAPTYIVSRHQARIYNVTDATVAVLGSSSFSAAGDNGSQAAWVIGRATIAGTKTFRLEHRCDVTGNTIGLGVDANLGQNEIYSEVLILREGVGNGGTPGELADRPIQIPISDTLTVPPTGDGQGHFVIPPAYNGFVLKDADAVVTTVSSSGAPTVAIRRERAGSAVDMLSTNITIDSGQKTSYNAGTQPVINASNDDVATGDIIYIDVDAIGTGAKGLAVVLTFGQAA